MKPLAISIALPVYNGADYLREALDSILGQSFGDFELVVSENRSVDETPTILAEYARRDKRLLVYPTDAFLPQVANVNRSVELCSGEWVKLFCHDDLMYPHCLESLCRLLAEEKGIEEIGLVGHGDEWLFANGYRYRLDLPFAGVRVWQGRTYLKEWFEGGGDRQVGVPALTTALVRKKSWQQTGKFDGRFAHFDVFLWMQLLVNWHFAYMADVLATTRIHSAQVAVSARKTMRSMQDHRIFWPEFLHSYGDILDLGKITDIKLRLKPLVIAGTAIAIELIKKRPLAAAHILRQLPLLWWPLLPFFITRTWRQESKKLWDLRQHVPLSMIYPD